MAIKRNITPKDQHLGMSTDKQHVEIPISNTCHSAECFGILAGDEVEGEQSSPDDLRPGDMIFVWDTEQEKWASIGRIVEVDATHFHVQEHHGTYLYERNDAARTIYRAIAVTRRVMFERDTPAALNCNTREQRIAELREQLDQLTDSTEESARFRVEQELYDIEHAGDEADEWPEFINGTESAADSSSGKEVD